MAIKPSECTQLQEQEIADLARLEKYIDRTLQEKYIEGEDVSLYIDKPSKRVLEQLFKTYREAGWVVKISAEYNGSFRNEPPSMQLTFTA